MLTNTPPPTVDYTGTSSRERYVLARLSIDWRAVRQAERACCCPSRPTVVAVIPPSPGRAHATELLLCGHHYRRSRRALTAAGAAVLDPAGLPVPPQQAWVGEQGGPGATR
ncbi:MAG TPA: hypothetical protein VMI33_12060 [Streptosporangiaceae bacterium]|nr:hypothetical protein [Streptosporangiaceae bacterium]